MRVLPRSARASLAVARGTMVQPETSRVVRGEPARSRSGREAEGGGRVESGKMFGGLAIGGIHSSNSPGTHLLL